MPKVGYVTLIGRPNVGKSTLLNAIIAEKVSAVSARPQTTQRVIPGIFTDEDREIQIIFLDTPGLHQVDHDAHDGHITKKNQINHYINGEAFAGLREADLILRLFDPTRPRGAEDARIDEILERVRTPILRVETKQDIITRPYTEPNIDLRVDSINHIGIDRLIDAIVTYLPEGPYLYNADYYTDQSIDFRIIETIREVLFAHLEEEIPYASYVTVENTTHEKNIMRIEAYISTETESQKSIIIGKNGSMITRIGTDSRIELERIFDKKIWLGLRVKVDKNWRKNEKKLRELFGKK